MRWFRAFLKWTLILTIIVAVIGLVVAGYAYQKHVVEEPGDHLREASIREVIAQESPVLYRDGETRLGVLFGEEHREYVPFERIPKAWIDAIVAAEDDRYFQHLGIDPKGILRAMVKNAKAGRMVAGGSTLTQQTAKNLYYRPDRSLKSKLEEAANALRLEEHYSKEQILEFYANQFHVSGNGRGLGIAARYFFDKPAEELGTLECAFIAGMVQAPARFNPFLGDTEEAQQAARARARWRTTYVLDRMVEVGSLDQATRDALVATEIPFKKGEFRYASSAVLDAVSARLEEAPFPELFASLGIDNPSTAGISIVTTIDATAQREATWALRHHLTEVGMFLEKTPLSALALPASRAPERDPDNPPAVHEFSTARVRTATAEGMVLDLGGTACVVDKAGLQRMADILAAAFSGVQGKKANDEDLAKLVAGLPVGTIVLASISHEGSCDLEYQPQLQGAVLALDDGQIRAMVGGTDNRDFNRALDAKRQLGSTWKPLIYFAALQLGWTPTDALDNRGNVFPYQATWYYPRPDHQSTDAVSLSWAGTRSENLASIWLLYHLTDRLEPAQFRAVAELVGLAPKPGESEQAYIERIRDEHGILSTPSRRDELAFEAAKAEVLAKGLGNPADALNLRSLIYGRGAEEEEARLKKTPAGPERDRQLAALRVNFLRLEANAGAAGEGDALVGDRVHRSTLQAVRQGMARHTLVLEAAGPYAFETLAMHPDFRVLVNMRYVSALASRLGLYDPLPPILAMPLGAVDIRLEEAAVLYQAMRDGQIWSFPGKSSQPSAIPGLRSEDRVASPARPTQLIAEMRDRDGNVIYKAKPVPEPVADPVAGRQSGDILRNVVRWGTGRRATGAVTLDGVAVPVAGKTGTTNGYKNAAFLGYVPKADGDAWRGETGLTVAVYVGYDDNRPMKRGATKIQGASGALPVWLGTAQGLSQAGLLGKSPAKGGEWAIEDDLRPVALMDGSGLPSGAPLDAELEGGGARPTALVAVDPDNADEPQRRFMPFAPPNGHLSRPAVAVAGPVEAPPAPALEEGALAPAELSLDEEPAEEEMDSAAPPRILPPEEAAEEAGEEAPEFLPEE